MKNNFTATFLIIFLLTSLPSAFAYAEAFLVVVHPSNPTVVIDKKTLADMFLKKKAFWPNNRPVVVVDQAPASITRQHFSLHVLMRPVSAIKNYWQKILFSGKGVPPTELKTNQEVINYIAVREDAIGYVSLGTEISPLKAIVIR